MKRLQAVLMFLLTFVVFSGSALAHVVVKPGEVLTGAYQTFVMSVPNEKDIPTVSMKLLIPAGLESVTPTVKPGWTINVEKTGEGENAKVTSISWTGGSIPAGQRDEFSFSVKAPAAETNLQWKAYQTYADGVTVAWDQDPSAQKGDDESAPTGPFSVTKVVKKLSSTNAAVSQAPTPKNDNTTKAISIAALAVALAALAFATRKPANSKK